MRILAVEATGLLDFDFVLKALGYGAMGVTAIVLCLSYLLVRQLASADPTRSPAAGVLELVQKYMRFALICTGAMIVLQVTDQVLRMYVDREVAALRYRVLSPERFDEISEWHWQWAEGGWETKGGFAKAASGKYRFTATTLYKGCGGNETIMTWESTEPISIADDGSQIVFLGKRRVVASDSLREKLKLGPPIEYPTRFTFNRSWALTGRYSGPDGGGPFGDIMFYAPRK
jgi:hypothetical protein